MRIPGRLTILTAALLLLAGATALLSATGIFTDGEQPDISRVARIDSATDLYLGALERRVAAYPQDTQGLTQLGFAYLQKARESGDPAFYTRAEGALTHALTLDAGEPSALVGMSSVSLARHDFPQALQWGEQALDLGADDPDVHGVIGDALIELGRYEEAVAAFQRMVDMRPDLSSYVRVAYARELHGDMIGAIEAMELAVEAGGPKGENAAWTQLQMGHLHFNSGDLDSALVQYEASLRAFPGYVHALAGLARVAAARGDYDEAIELYSGVVARQPIVEYVAALGDVYRAAGRDGEAQRQYDLVGAIDSLYRANGIDTDLEMALFLADHDIRIDEAVAQARAVYEMRPGSVRAADALSWALYKAGDYDEALAYSKAAVQLGTQDPLLLFHAGMVSYKAGDGEAARDYLSRAVEINPSFSVLYAEEAADTLEELRSAVRG